MRVAVIRDGAVPPPAAYGLAKLEEALRLKGYDAAQAAAADHLILAGVRSTAPEISAVLKRLKTPLPEGPETLVIRKGAYKGKPAVFLCGGDARGLMYAALETAERIGWAEEARDPFQFVRDVSERPYLAERGISIYTMQRAYFESRLWDENYWRKYFDLLAASRINTILVIFGYENGGFMAPLYPYFFDLPEFPEIRLVGITRQEQERNTAAFRAMMRIAHERGIGVAAGIWDHIYRGGVQGGGIPGASENAGKRVPGLVWGVTGENLAGYTKAALKRFLEVFPEIDAIQFRMHDESGLKREEVPGFWHEVFALIKRARPNLRIDLRAKELPDSVIEDALAQGLEARVSTKYWMEQMGLPFHPTHINRQNQRDRRHGYADLLRYPQRYRVHWQLWSGGTARLLLWGDPDYVRRFAESARLYDGTSFEVNEMLATKMLGEPHDAPPRPIHNPRYRHYDYEFERYWHFYRLWGRLTYNPQTPPEVWEREFLRRFGPQAGPHLMSALHLASRVLPRIVASSYLYRLFPTTRGWAEMQRQGSLAEFAGEEGSDTQQFMNLRDAARSILEGTDTAMRRPEENSRWFSDLSGRILAEAAQAEKLAGARAGAEFQTTLTDLKILAALARYHSWRLLAGLHYNLGSFDEAVSHEKKAIQAWSDIVAAAGDVYREDLAFGVHRVGFPRHWKEELALLQRDFDKLIAARPAAARATAVRLREPGGTPPRVSLEPPPVAVPGRDVVVRVKAASAAGIKWVRLRYRHLTQFEDYETAGMTLDPKTGVYTGRIPAAFIDPKWDLMYFVEVVDNRGNGRMYPDLEASLPYVIVKVRR